MYTAQPSERLIASVKVSVMFVPASVTVVLVAASNVGADTPAESTLKTIVEHTGYCVSVRCSCTASVPICAIGQSYGFTHEVLRCHINTSINLIIRASGHITKCLRKQCFQMRRGYEEPSTCKCCKRFNCVNCTESINTATSNY